MRSREEGRGKERSGLPRGKLPSLRTQVTTLQPPGSPFSAGRQRDTCDARPRYAIGLAAPSALPPASHWDFRLAHTHH